MKRTKAFTMIELLVVIAIIAILTGILFPVFARAKLNAKKSGDMSSMNSLRASLQIYKEDQGGFPPALLGYITPYEIASGAAIVPANQYRGPLFPKKIDSLDTLRGQENRASESLMVPAAWPPADARPLGSAPVKDLNGDGALTAADDTALSRQAYSSNYASGSINYFFNDFRVSPSIGASSSTNGATVGRFYALSGYDVAPVPTPSGTVYELRYTLFWTGHGVGNGSPVDDPRQLGYSEPPDDTVITWNSFYRDYQGSTALRSGASKDMLLLLGGAARPVDSKRMSDLSWRFTN